MGGAGAAVGSAVFFALAPGVVAGVVPWWLTGWEATDLPWWWLPLRVGRGGLVVAGAGVLVHAFARFVAEGVGTPAPVAPTRELVVGGLYRYVRNPMYLAVLAASVGQALVLGRLVLLAYAAVMATAFVTFVRGYEEPTLAEQFGARYQAYRAAVPGGSPPPPGSRGDPGEPAVEPGRHPPVPAPDQPHHGRHEDGPDQGGVDQHGHGQAEAHLLERHQAAGGEGGQHRPHDQRRRGDGAGRALEAVGDGQLVVARAQVLLPDPAEQEDLVVHGQPEQDREQEQGHEDLDVALGGEPEQLLAPAP